MTRPQAVQEVMDMAREEMATKNLTEMIVIGRDIDLWWRAMTLDERIAVYTIIELNP